MAKKNNGTSETLREYKKWRNIHYALKVAPFPTLATPFAIELGVNWNVWFNHNEWSIGMGLGMAIVSTVASFLAVLKKDSEVMKKVGPFVSVGIAFLMWGAVCIFLSSVLNELGKLLIFAGCGVMGAAVENAIDTQVVKEKYDYMKQLATDTGLNKKGKWQFEKSEQAKLDMEKEYGNGRNPLSILNERQTRK